MAMGFEDERSPLPAGRAFVVRLRAEANPEADKWSGRVEHVVSGRSEKFDSLVELESFLRRMVRGANER
jgi:hypothetical protein